MSIPDYRNVHKTHNTGPTKDWVCDYCQIPLTDENRAHIATKVICQDKAIYQLCKDCRERFFGNIDDNLMLKYAYMIAQSIREKKDDSKKR